MKDVLRIEWGIFLLAVQFLTRLPVPKDLAFSDDLLIRAIKYYPLVGVFVGGLGAAVLWAGALVFPMTVAVLLSLAATLFVTGAFHEDGLADAADGLGGGLTKERSLEIMRDSRIGTYGVVSLFMALALKVVVLSALPVSVAVGLLIVGHGLGRMACVHVIAITDYARAAGTKFVAPAVTPDGYRVALATGVVLGAALVVWLGPVVALTALVCCILCARVFRWMFVRKLGGYTGDCWVG